MTRYWAVRDPASAELALTADADARTQNDRFGHDARVFANPDGTFAYPSPRPPPRGSRGRGLHEEKSS